MIMIRIPVFCLLLILIAGCANNKSSKTSESIPPDSVLSEPLMIQVLADVHILEAGVQLKKNRGSNSVAEVEHLYDDLFRKYGISEDRFRMNMDYYRQDPANFEKF